MKKLSITEAELKESIAYKESVEIYKVMNKLTTFSAWKSRRQK